jgi:uncharacterized membrane protein YraQ (UPF0718 family)
MQFLILVSLLAIAASLVADRRKTWQGILTGLKMFVKLLPAILAVLVLVSIALYLLPNELIVMYLGEKAGITGYFIAAITGSIALIPGFIAYPLAGILVKTGVSYPVIAVFMTTLMMVGILTLPLEINYFGTRVSLVRNFLFLLAALLIGGIIGLFYLP